MYVSNEMQTPKFKCNTMHSNSKKVKYLGINQTKLVQDLYADNYTILKKDIKLLNKWRDIFMGWKTTQ